MGASRVSRRVMLEMAMSSAKAPSAVSMAMPFGAFEDAVGDGDVAEAAVGFGAALDAAVAAAAFGLLPGAVDERAE